MLPIALDLARVGVALVGRGAVLQKRLATLRQAGGRPLVFVPEEADVPPGLAGVRTGLPDAAALAGIGFVVAAGLDRAQAERVAAAARQAGALVNVEDVVDLCDVHLPALVRRGDLTIAVSTAGKSPALSRRLRRFIEGLVGEEWTDRLQQLAGARSAWKAQGKPPAELSRLSDAMIDEKGWLP